VPPEFPAVRAYTPALDDMVRQTRGTTSSTAGHGISLHCPEPWPEPVVLADLLDEISVAVRRHVVLPRSAADVVTLWIAHTWGYEKFEHSPRLGITTCRATAANRRSLTFCASSAGAHYSKG